jgi:hypothetical protein
MEPLALAVEYYVPCLQFDAAPKHRRVRACRKPYKHQPRSQRNISDARQILVAVQQLQAMERCPGQLGLKRTLRDSEEIDPHLAQARPVIIGIDKDACAASRHPPSCTPAE